MGLPYPPELERGLLHPPAPGEPSAVSVRAFVEHMVQPSAGGISIVGRELALPESSAEEDVLDAFRAAIADRLLARRAHLTREGVRHLEAVLGAELARHDYADRETLEVILETVDGL